MPGQVLFDPLVDAALRISDHAALSCGTREGSERRSRRDNVGEARVQLAITAVAQSETVLGVKQRETFRDRLDRIQQTLAALAHRLLGASALDHAAELGADMGHHVEERLVRLERLAGEEL